MKRHKSTRLAIVLIVVTTFIASTATRSLANVSINPRLYGLDRYQTSTAIANQFSNQTVDNVVLASGNDFPDALSASVLAHKLNAPILLVDSHTQTSSDALEYIGAHLKANGTIYIIGGQVIIGPDFDGNLTQKGYNVKRLGGVDRYDTDRLTVAALNSEVSGTVFIVSGENFPDALSISSFASNSNSPILLVKANSISQDDSYGNIRKAKTDGSITSIVPVSLPETYYKFKLNNHPSTYNNIVDGWIYYVSNASVYKMKLDGSAEQIVQ